MTNVETLMAVLAAFNDNDLEIASKLCHPRTTKTLRGHGPFAGTYEGVEEVRASPFQEPLRRRRSPIVAAATPDHAIRHTTT